MQNKKDMVEIFKTGSIGMTKDYGAEYGTDGAWYDGVYKSCGSEVIEKPSDEKDYMNRCTNVFCKNHKWHHIYDTEKLDYYRHKVIENADQ